MSRRLRLVLPIGLTASAVFAPACSPSTAPHAAPPPQATPQPPRRAGPFDARVLEVARVYREEFTRVSDRANWAPTRCEAPVPGGALQSASRDSATHGRKLYFLFAKDAADYTLIGISSLHNRDNAAGAPWKAVIGQSLVKQSFVPVLVPAGEEPQRLTNDPEHREHPPEYARDDNGAFYRTGEPAALFIMLKLDPATPDTDEGWVYATTTPDGSTVLAAGRVALCMECHTQTTRDRLYGPLWSWPVDPVTAQRLTPTRGSEAPTR